jgi:class 3 adenylate cyclase
MNGLPTGTVTMLFTDIEGSTPLVHRLEGRYAAVLADYRRLLRSAVSEAGGHEVECRADELFAVFQGAREGVAAAVSAQRMLSAHSWPGEESVRVRMGLHTGEPAVEGAVYLGFDVHRAARICAAGHGGQILLSQSTRDLVAEQFDTRDLGAHVLAGVDRPERIFQLLAAELRTEFPPLRAGSAEPRRRRLPRRHAGRPTLTDGAWKIRSLLPETAPALQQPLAELGAALFTADRALTGADQFLARVDHERLARRLAEQRNLGVSSERARAQAASLEKSAASVEVLLDRRQTLAGLSGDLADKLGTLRTGGEIVSLRDRVEAATKEVDDALTLAAQVLDPMSYKLTRTRHRGIYRSGRNYVVPYVDDRGTERQREFETWTEARDFRSSLRTAQKAQKNYTGGSTKFGEYDAGAGGPS